MRCRRIFGLMFAGAHAFRGCAKRFSAAVRILTSIDPEDGEIISCTVDVRNTDCKPPMCDYNKLTIYVST